MRRWIAAWGLWLILVGGQAVAAPGALPEAGVAAEEGGDWERALVIYSRELEAAPDNPALWHRLADLQAKLGRNAEALRAREEAVRYAPEDAALHFRLAQAYSGADQPKLALAACHRAVELAPDQIDYWEAQAQLANWAGDNDMARATYEHLLGLDPQRRELLLSIAKVKSWQGELDAAVVDFQNYLAASPEDADALIAYARTESWRGDYAAAMGALERYLGQRGADDLYLQEKARVLAWAEKSEQALALVEPFAAASPEDYQINFTQTLALRKMRRPEEAIERLEVVERLEPERDETLDLGRSTRMPLRSRVSLAPGYYTDEDIDIAGLVVQGSWRPTPRSDFNLRWRESRYSADESSAYAPVGGGTDIDERNLSVGFSYLLSPAWLLGGRVGREDAEEGGQFTTYEGFLDWRPNADFSARFGAERELFGVSPRAVSLGIERDTLRVRAIWSPGLRDLFDVEWVLDDLSDGNRRRSLLAGWRHTTLRTQRYNLDLGATAWWMGYDEDLSNGYYDPERYELYLLTGNCYWKIDDDNGIAVALGLGIQRDESFDRFEFASDASIEGIFGIFQDWHLRVRLGYSDRQQMTGAFDAYSLGVVLEYRF